MFRLALLFLFTSCALFQGEKSLKYENKEKLLKAVKINGEGRGRLTLKENQYLFGFESGLQDNHDWILAVQIPLHGEEMMVLSDLSKKEAADPTVDSFEARIDNDFKKLGLDKWLTTQEFVNELRSLVRFKMAQNLNLKPSCQEKFDELICELDAKKFHLRAEEKEFFVLREMKRGAIVVLSGSILSKSSFERTDIRLYPTKENFLRKKSVLSLELFWKD